MRLKILIPVLLCGPMLGCNGLHFARGLPVIARSPAGILISDAGGIPDLQRGNQARLAGRLDAAERDLLPLATRGYPDAELYLAAVYGQRESTDAQDAAIVWYRKVLPRRPEAAVPLARTFMRKGDPAALLEAERLLLQAQLEHPDPAVSAALLDLYSEDPQLDVKRRAAALAQAGAVSTLVGLRSSAINWYRATIGDPGHARRLLELCRKNLDAVPTCYVDLATYYRYSGNHKALDELVTQAVQALRRVAPASNFDSLDYDPIQLPQVAGRLAFAMVEQASGEDLAEANEEFTLAQEAETEAQAEAGDENVDAQSAQGAIPQYAALPAQAAAPSQPASPSGNAEPELANRLLRWMLKEPGAMPTEAAGVAVSFPYLLPDVNLEAVLKSGVAGGIARASLFLGELYYFNQRVPREASLGQASLQQSLKFRETIAAGHYRLGRLYQQGYLGRPDPQKALDNFLYAARHRVTAADTHLARLFYDSPGARINRVNSYVFARLSADAGMPVIVHTLRGGVLSAYKLLDRLHAELTAEELKKADSLYRQELAVHLVPPPAVSPDIWVKEAG
jgi:hypothetical protein